MNILNLYCLPNVKETFLFILLPQLYVLTYGVVSGVLLVDLFAEIQVLLSLIQN